MGKTGRILRGVVAGLICGFTGAAAEGVPQTPPPVEAFGALPKASAPQLAPDGQHFAVIQAMQGRPVALIYPTFAKPGVGPVVFDAGDAMVESVQWASNAKLIVTTKYTKRYEGQFNANTVTFRRAFAFGAEGGKAIALMRNRQDWINNTNAATVLDVALNDPDHIYMTMWQEGPHLTAMRKDTGRKDANTNGTFELDVFKVDLNSGDAEPVSRGLTSNLESVPTTIHWLMDGQGAIVARIDGSIKPLISHVMVPDGKAWKEIGAFDSTADKDSGLSGLLDKEQALIFQRWNEKSFSGIVKTDLNGTNPKDLYYVDGYDADGILYDEWTGRVIGSSYVDDRRQYHYFDPALQALQKGLEQAFPGRSVHIASMDVARRFVIIGVDGPRQPPTYYLLDRTTHLTQVLTESYPGLHEADLGEMKPYPYAARDGVQIHSYLTLPPGKEAKNLPVVILPHGGPDARDALAFDWKVQFLASRGYAVLQPNFRGSYGYGHKFTELGLAEWGKGVQNDVTDGVKKLIADGIADPKRVCIFGGSFGGYVALAGATLTPELYACSASWAGVSDLEQQLHTSYKEGGEYSQLVSYWQSRMGKADDYTQRARLQAGSPDRQVENVRAPILLMHGVKDTTVPLEQSQLMRDALKMAHKKVTYIEFPEEDHYMDLASSRIGVLKALEQFLKENIGN